MTVSQALQALLVLCLTVPVLTDLENQVHVSQCQHWQVEFARSQDSVSVSLNFRGTWVSERCEVRPGPEFVLRRYHLLNDRSFHLLQFYFLDESCSLPAFSISAWGRLQLMRGSWIVPGGYESDYVLHRVMAVPYSNDMAEFLAHRVNRSCPGQVTSPWRPFKKYRLLSYVELKRHSSNRNKVDVVEDVDCMDGLHISLHELQLMRLEHRKPFYHHHRHKPHDFRSEMFFGAQNPQHGRHFRPTSYQPPLLPLEAPNCPVCRHLSRSSDISPPQLSAQVPLHVDLSGEWISSRCEVRPYGLFLTRQLKFYESLSSWAGTYRYYRDPNCKNPMFRLEAEGEFVAGPPSARLRGATDFDFQVSRALLTPQDSLFVANLNGHRDGTCGPRGGWRINVTLELTSAGGCNGLGLEVPTVELDVARMEKDTHGNTLLYLGQSSDKNRRPTAYQPALVKCSEEFEPGNFHDNALYPLPHVQMLRGRTQRMSASLSLCLIGWLVTRGLR